MDPAAAGKTVRGGEPRALVASARGSRCDRGRWSLALRPAVVAALAAGRRASARRRRRLAALRTQALARRAALRQSERRQGAGLSRRRHHRGSDDRACAHPRPVRHLAQRRLHLQGQGRAAGADRQGTRRPLHPRRQHPPRRRRHAHQCPADRRRRPAAMSGPSASTARGRDVFALQDKVVGNVAGALKLRLVGGQRKADISRRHRAIPPPTTSICGA